ncbi:MAG: creatininase family protein [Puniceicoccaceae bacterium]
MKQGMDWPRYWDRYLPAMRQREIDSIPEKDRAVVILTTGAIEQHGPHLPVGVDAFLGQMFLDAALPKLSADLPVYVAPPIQIGKSNEHDGFPGTLTISHQHLRRLVGAAIQQLKEWGFCRIRILNTHGGNIQILRTLLREYQLEGDLDVAILEYAPKIELGEEEARFGIHAGEFETSLFYAVAPDLTAPDLADCCWIGQLGDGKVLRPELAPATYAWKTADISPTGTMGDARAATEAKGWKWLEEIGAAIAETLRQTIEG